MSPTLRKTRTEYCRLKEADKLTNLAQHTYSCQAHSQLAGKEMPAFY
jgi:hypothetical protein